jgi:2-polyprenyl-3-methyl-5-hydroxy-6-metoxy-1,4-benzoquinol methylase
MRRLNFLIRVMANYTSDQSCPYCSCPNTKLIERKFLVLHLRRCPECGLRFRWPKEDAHFLAKFYQNKYEETIPEGQLFDEHIANGFVGWERDYSAQFGVLKEVLPAGRVLDYGCSWGYGAYQMNRVGYQTLGFEISKPRAELGRKKLGIEIIDSLSALDSLPDASFDGIFASHVLEHLQSLKEVFGFFARVLRPGGIAMILVPNAGGKMACELGTGWGPMISEKHTLALDGEFFLNNMSGFGFEVRVISDPYDQNRVDAVLNDGDALDRDGQELMVIARKTFPDRVE